MATSPVIDKTPAGLRDRPRFGPTVQFQRANSERRDSAANDPQANQTEKHQRRCRCAIRDCRGKETADFPGAFVTGVHVEIGLSVGESADQCVSRPVHRAVAKIVDECRAETAGEGEVERLGIGSVPNPEREVVQGGRVNGDTSGTRIG